MLVHQIIVDMTGLLPEVRVLLLGDLREHHFADDDHLLPIGRVEEVDHVEVVVRHHADIAAV